MKKLYVSLLLATALVSCKKETVNYALFSGTIKNQNSDEISITDSKRKLVKTIKVSKEGVFSDTIFDANGRYSFVNGNESSSIYLKNGYDVKLTMDAKEFDESIVYTGKGSADNTYLSKKFLLEEKSGIRDARSLYALNETEFLGKLNSYKDELGKLTKGLDKDFLETETLENKYAHIMSLKNYERYHSMVSRDKDFKVSADFPDATKDLKFDNEDHFKKSEMYKSLVLSDLFGKIRTKSQKEGKSNQAVALETIKGLKSDLIKQEAVKSLAYEINANNENVDEVYKGIMAISTDKDFKKEVTAKYNKLKTLVKGKPSPKFENYENYNGGTTSLDDLKGKYVYIDVWATWCGPCKGEIPFLKKVEKQYHGKNIAFVSISIDKKKDHDTWKNMVAKEELKGVQLFADSAWSSKFVKDYGIQGIPRFILLDPNGNIVTANAPRPSSPKLIELFNELKI